MAKNEQEKEIEGTEETEETEKKGKSELTPAEENRLRGQVKKEYLLCDEHTQGWRTTQLKRLKLYNNQKRDQSKVGDPLLFSVFNTVLAALYDDRLGVKYGAKEEGDHETAENLDALARHDHIIMEKDELDYEWDWDSAFFGEGFMLLYGFDRRPEAMCPVAEVLDPMTLLKDPRATSMNGNQKGTGRARFWGREFGLSKSEMEAHGSYFNVKFVKKAKDIKSLMDKAAEERRTARGYQSTRYKEESLDENYEYQLLEWWTYVKGKKYITTWANNRNLLIRYQEVKGDFWPVIDRVLFPMSHGDKVSIPDLIEDKQRARSVMINLGMESAIADLYPSYLFNKRKIPNPRDLSFAFNKFIPVQGDVAGVIAPIQKSVFHQQVNLILNILDVAAQKAVAAPEVAQGIQPSKARTLGETQMIAAGKDVRHSLGARIWGWSERRFWRQHYFLYKTHFKEEIDKKVIRIQGPLAPAWRPLLRENIVAQIDPDIVIESSYVAGAQRKAEFQEFYAFSQVAIQDPTTNRRYIFRKLGAIQGRTKAEMTLMFPPTIDEMRAEDENQKLSNNKLPKIHPLDDDIIHIEIHNRAADRPAKLAHIEAHKMMMMKKKEKPELYPPAEPVPEFKPVGAPKEAPVGRTDARMRAGAEEKIEEKISV